jgi:hypothetical protein
LAAVNVSPKPPAVRDRSIILGSADKELKQEILASLSLGLIL